MLDYENCNKYSYWYFCDFEYLVNILDLFGLTLKNCCFSLLHDYLLYSDPYFY